MLISVIVQVLSDDGGVLSTAINGAAVALLNAGALAFIRHSYTASICASLLLLSATCMSSLAGEL
jgi:ribonuclease PH